MKIILLPALAALLAGCVLPPPPPAFVDASIDHEMAKASGRKAPPVPQLEGSLLPPLRMEMPLAGGAPIDARFDLSVSNAPAAQVFNSIVAGTRYSMLVHPSVVGSITVNLKEVTIREALDSIRDLYGYEYKMDGTRILIQPAGIQTRVFQVNYLSGQRRGLSQLRVTSNSQSELISGGTGTTSGTSGVGGVGGVGGLGGVAGSGSAATGTQAGAATGRESTRVTTNQEATFWSDLCEALVALTFPDAAAAAGGSAGGQPEDRQRAICNRRHAASDRSIVVSPHSGVVVVRATAGELRAVENYLRATRIAVERQVMLEAKIIEVTLSDQYQSGINWLAFNSRGAVGQVTTTGFPAGFQGAATANLVGSGSSTGAIFGLALATSNFSALLTFLETQGNVQVLSSPRVATLNNQKAVLKVGEEQLLVSNISASREPSVVAGGAATTVITPTFSPYFDGIVLDVTPQIDDTGTITLHVHPSINNVIASSIKVPVGATAPVDVPTAISRVRETDTIVRVTDGNIVAIGGLMRTETSDVRGGVPGVPDGGIFGFLFRNTDRLVRKIELVILLKPTIIDSDREWARDVRETRERLDGLGRQMREGRR